MWEAQICLYKTIDRRRVLHVKAISLMIRSRLSGQNLYYADGMTRNQKTTINTVSPATNAAFNLFSNASGISMVHLLFPKKQTKIDFKYLFCR